MEDQNQREVREAEGYNMIKQISKSQDKVSFLIDGINETIANAIRRSALEIPVLAIDEVEFIKNDSALYDEILAHRLCLIPLQADKTFEEREECSCKGKGCSKCTVSFKLQAKGPSTVYSDEIEGKTAKPVFDKMPIVILTKGQELEFNAYAILGKGKKHAKFSPGIIAYRQVAQFSVGKDCNLCDECVKSCPLKLITNEGKKISFKELDKCDICESCIETCNKKGKKCISMDLSKDNFIFNIESFGQLSPKEIFIESVKAMNKNLTELGKQVK